MYTGDTIASWVINYRDCCVSVTFDIHLCLYNIPYSTDLLNDKNDNQIKHNSKVRANLVEKAIVMVSIWETSAGEVYANICTRVKSNWTLPTLNNDYC